MAQISRPVMTLRGDGTTFWLHELEIVVQRGRTTWTVPLAAIGRIASVSGRPGTSQVRLELSGGSDAAWATVTTRNGTAADAFVRSAQGAMSDVRTVAYGPDLVVCEQRALRLPPLPLHHPKARRFLAVAAYLVFALVAIAHADDAWGGAVVYGLVLPPLAASAVLRVWRGRYRDLLNLRRCGITVPGQFLRTEWVHRDGESEERHVYEYVTLEGRRHRQRGRINIYLQRKTGALEVTYDPQQPSLMQPGRLIEPLVLQALLMAIGLTVTLLFIAPLLAFATAIGLLG
ncbi:hypothetical protein [Streptomyces sp. HUAS TT7]|uniref:hypothetical protein n=1 Tax=Streptomyces sp. HUAS TT7 TaxID=3447507 RepID=UPI003F65C65E